MLWVTICCHFHFDAYSLTKSTSCKSKSNIPRVVNAHAPTTTLHMSYTSFFIHQPQLSLLNSNQPFLFYSIRRLWDCHRRLRTFLDLVHCQFTSLGTIDAEHSQVGYGQPELQAFSIELLRESQSRNKKKGGGEKRKRLPANPRILENAP